MILSNRPGRTRALVGASKDFKDFLLSRPSTLQKWDLPCIPVDGARTQGHATSLCRFACRCSTTCHSADRPRSYRFYILFTTAHTYLDNAQCTSRRTEDLTRIRISLFARASASTSIFRNFIKCCTTLRRSSLVVRPTVATLSLQSCLHIDFAKEAYRASNRRDYEEQMVKWLGRQEAVVNTSIALQT